MQVIIKDCVLKLRLWKGWAFEDLVVSSQHHSFSSKVAFLKHFQVFLQRICSAYVTMKHKRGLVGSDRAQFKNNVSKNMQTGMSFIYRQKILFEKNQWVSTPIKNIAASFIIWFLCILFPEFLGIQLIPVCSLPIKLL